MPRKDFHKVVLGRAEPIDLVDFGLVGIPAKVDTGAYHSSLHAEQIALSSDGGTLTFRLFAGHPVSAANARDVTVREFAEVDVQNSFGHREKRFQIRLKVKLGPKIFKAYFTLANRNEMSYPVLLGRELLNRRFLVDTSLTKVPRSKLPKPSMSNSSDNERDTA